MSPAEFWAEFDRRAEMHRATRQARVGGRDAPLDAVQEAQATARRLFKAKKQQEAAE